MERVVAYAPLMLHLLFIGNFPPARTHLVTAGAEVSGRLRAAGHDVIVVSRWRARPLRLADMIAAALRHRRRYAVASIDVYSGLAFIYAEVIALVLKRLGKPYVLALHGGNLPDFRRRHPRRVLRLLRSAAAVATPSRYLLDAMIDARQDIELIPNGVDWAALRHRERSGPSPRLVWIRSFHAMYNPSLAVEVLALLVAHGHDAQLVMVGPDRGDGSGAAVRKLADRLGVASRLLLPGGVPKAALAGYLDEADIFLNTTNVDNMPVSVIEAMAAGLCVVSTRVGGIPYLLQDQVDALLVPPGDAAAMAAAVERLLADRVLAGNLSRAARASAERFDWGRVLPLWTALLGRAGGGS